MSKTLKMTILLVIITLGFLFLGTEVKAVEVNSKDALFQALDTQNQTVTDTTITLTADIETDIVDFCEYDWILDLNGHTLTAMEFYVNDGSLTINDSKGNGKLNSMFTMICEGATAVINNGIFSNGNLELINNEGTLTINNGIFHSIWNLGTLTINDGEFASISCDEGKLNINGGTFTSYRFTEEVDGEELYMDYFSMFNIKSATITITGGEFKADGIKEALRIYGNNENEVNKDSINDIMGLGYSAEYKLNEENCDSWQMSYSSIKVIEDELLNKIAPKGIWDFGGLKPKDFVLANEMLTKLVMDVFEPLGYSAYASVSGNEENFDPEKITICVYNDKGFEKEYPVSVKYLPENSEKISIVKPVLNKMRQYKDYSKPSVETAYVLEDLYLINYLFANAGEEYLRGDQALNFSKELIDATGGANISFDYIPKMGDGTTNRLYSYSSGEVIVYYEGKPLTTMIAASLGKYVLYIPDNVDINDDDAVIAAATKRIKDYIGNDIDFKIEDAGTLASIKEYNPYTLYDETKTGDNYYHLKIGKKTYNFVICEKEASKLEQPKYVGNNLASNVVITSDTTTIPLDTAITVKNVEDKKIKEVLGTNVYEAYDITLYSNAKQDKVDSGNFKVTIPVPEKLKNITDLTVYYIDSEGNKTDHKAKLNEDGTITFETDHFSTYILAEKIEETYKVVFDANEGRFKDEKTLTIDKWANGMEETLEIPTREGFKFLGFFTEKTGGTKLENYIAEAGIDENLTFYAQWEELASKEETTTPESESSSNDNNAPAGNNPQTSDNILFFVGMFAVAAIGLTITTKFRKNYKTK